MLCLLTKMLFRRLAGRLVYTYIAIAYGLTSSTPGCHRGYQGQNEEAFAKGGGLGYAVACGSFLRVPVAW